MNRLTSFLAILILTPFLVCVMLLLAVLILLLPIVVLIRPDVVKWEK